jgi:hypothetical protein
MHRSSLRIAASQHRTWTGEAHAVSMCSRLQETDPHLDSCGDRCGLATGNGKMQIQRFFYVQILVCKQMIYSGFSWIFNLAMSVYHLRDELTRWSD